MSRHNLSSQKNKKGSPQKGLPFKCYHCNKKLVCCLIDCFNIKVKPKTIHKTER